MLKPGFLIDEKYRIERFLGSGSFGIVYLAVNIRSGRKWAVKEIRKVQREGVGVQEIFQNEIEVLKKLDHKNLASIADFYETEESYLIFTDYLEGITLDRFREQNFKQTGKDLNSLQIMTIAFELCDAILYLQENKLIHGDIKPSNIMITKENRPVLIDFGGAVTGYGKAEKKLLFWTPGYSPPEAKWGAAGFSRDVYSFGAVLYRLVTGEAPKSETYLGSGTMIVKKWQQSLLGQTYIHRNEKLRIERLGKVILRCLQPEPDRRFSNAFLLSEVLEKAAFGKEKKVNLQEGKYTVAFLILILGFSIISVFGGNMKRTWINKAYENCLKEAKHCVKEEAAQYYRLAIMLEPAKKDGYLGLIDTLSVDNELSGEDDAVLTKAMNAVEYNRGISNEQALKTNEEEYFDVAYRLGITYYYCYFDLQKTAAFKYLSDAAETDLRQEMGNSLREEQKKKSDILVRMIRYGNTIGVPDKRGQNEITYTDYWNDMKELLKVTPKEGEDDLTYLWICVDVLNKILNDTDKFLNEGISINELEKEAEEIRHQTKDLDHFSGIQADKLKKQIVELIPLVSEKLEAEAYTAKAQPGGKDDRESSR